MPKHLTDLRLEGTYRPDRHASRNGSPPATSPAKPPDLPPRQSELWDLIMAEKGDHISEADGALLLSLVQSHDYMQGCERILAMNPADREARIAYTSYGNMLTKLSAMFALGPVNRGNLPEPEKKSAAAEFLK